MCASIDDCLKTVIDGEAGSTIINSFRSGTILKNRIYNDILFQPLSTLDERCFGVRVGNPELLRILNRGIYELGYDFGINVSYNYTDGLYKYSIFDFLGDNIGLVLFCSFFVILLIVLFFIRRQIRLKKQTEKTVKLSLNCNPPPQQRFFVCRRCSARKKRLPWCRCRFLLYFRRIC